MRKKLFEKIEIKIYTNGTWDILNVLSEGCNPKNTESKGLMTYTRISHDLHKLANEAWQFKHVED